MHKLRLAVGSLSIALVMGLAPMTAAAQATSPLNADDTCPGVTTGHVVADRAERAIERCTGDTVSTQLESTSGSKTESKGGSAILAKCIYEARKGGFRPADRLEYSIVKCVTERTTSTQP